MTDEQRAHLERRLHEERDRLLQTLSDYGEESSVAERDQDGDITAYPFHPADQGTDTMRQELDSMIASQETRMLSEIDEALRRLVEEPERYGRCEVDGEEIAFERLDVLPAARICERHAENAER